MKKKIKPRLKIILTLGSLFILGTFLKSPSTDTFKTFLSSKEPVIYSNQCGDDSLKVLCDAIDSAHDELFVRIYNLTAPAVFTSFVNQANAGKAVSIHYQTMKRKNEFPKTSKVTLVEHPAEGRKLMHQKALAIDDKYAWLGSANYTINGLVKECNLIIGLKSPELCQYIKDETSGTCVINGQNAQYFSLPGDHGKALSAVLKVLKTAQKTIRIAMYALTYPPIFQELNEAQKRGVNVQLLVDKEFKKLSIHQIEALKNSNLVLGAKTTPYRLHHKFAVVDDKILIAGSTNWSEGGFNLNSEDLIILDNLTSKQIKKLNCIWADLETQCAIAYPPIEESKVIPLPKEKEAA
ncbi:phospholipase D-like domain-containing protein [Chlamydia vaughanii]|uniref:phospholipase D-like domain-containing protein n=1 Tax=Chlamydia vaughanii TaxID=3112552 RepID=UPI0032B12937